MKLKIKRLSFSALMLLASLTHLSAQQKKKISEGKIIYSVQVKDSSLSAEEAAMIPKESVVLIKGNMIRTQILSTMFATTFIFNTKDQTSVTLMDMLGNKFAIRNTAQDREKEKTKHPKPEVRLLNETKMIAGYNCKKAELIYKDGKKSVVFYTTDIASKHSNLAFQDINGFPLEYELEQNNMAMKMSAKSVKEEKIADSNFSIPADYKETTREEMSKLFMSGK